MYCPKCGANLGEPDWVVVNPSTNSKEATIRCDDCEVRIDITDESSYYQEGAIEIEYR